MLVVALKSTYWNQQIRKRGDKFHVKKGTKLGTAMRRIAEEVVPEDDLPPEVGEDEEEEDIPFDEEFPEVVDEDDEPELAAPPKKKTGKKTKKKAAKKTG